MDANDATETQRFPDPRSNILTFCQYHLPIIGDWSLALPSSLPNLKLFDNFYDRIHICT